MACKWLERAVLESYIFVYLSFKCSIAQSYEKRFGLPNKTKEKNRHCVRDITKKL